MQLPAAPSPSVTPPFDDLFLEARALFSQVARQVAAQFDITEPVLADVGRWFGLLARLQFMREFSAQMDREPSGYARSALWEKTLRDFTRRMRAELTGVMALPLDPRDERP